MQETGREGVGTSSIFSFSPPPPLIPISPAVFDSSSCFPHVCIMETFTQTRTRAVAATLSLTAPLCVYIYSFYRDDVALSSCRFWCCTHFLSLAYSPASLASALNMHLLGVELWCCRCNRYFIIDTIIVVVVVAVCVPVFITVSAARVYTGILLGAAVIVLCRLWRFLPSHKRWVEQQASKMAAKLVAERRIMRPSTQLPWLPPEDPSTGRKDAVASPVYYPCAAPSSTLFCSYCCGAPVSGYGVPLPTPPFTGGGHLPYGGYTMPPPTPPPPPPLAIRSSFSSPGSLSPCGPLGRSPCSLLLPPPSPLPQQQVGDRTTLDRKGSPALSHRVSMASRASSGRHSSVGAIAGEGDARADLMHSLPASPVPLVLQGASYASLEVKSLAPNASRSPQGSHHLRSGASPSSVFLSQGDGTSLSGSSHHLRCQRSRSSSPPYSFLGERPLWQGKPSASPSRSPIPASPALHHV